MGKKELRADARQNRATLLRAAALIFARHGFDAPLELVAAEAGVSRTTLYRNFVDRDALGFAIFEQSIEELQEAAKRVSGSADGFSVVLDLLFERSLESAGVAHALSQRSEETELIPKLRRRTISVLLPLLRTAQASGKVHPGIDKSDLEVFLQMLGSSTQGPPNTRKERATRAIAILRRGLTLA